MRTLNRLQLAAVLLALMARPACPADAPKPAKAEAESPAAQAEKLFSEGRDLLFQGQYQKAIELLTKAVAADGTKTSYRLHLARAHRYAGDTKKAEIILEEILKAAPDHVEAGQLLAEIHTAAQRWDDVVRVLEPLLKYRHDYPTYHMLAEAQYNRGEHEKAREYYKEAVKLNPQSASDHYQLGNLYLAGNFFALAAESYEAAARLGIETPVLHYKLGSAYFNLRNHFGQIAVRTVKSGEPGTISDDWYLIERVPGGKDVFRCAPKSSAIYHVSKALAEGIEDRPDIHILRANIYLNARRYQQAYDMFTKIGSTVPDEDKALFHYYHAQAAFGTDRHSEYLELLKKAIELDPDAYKSTLVDAYVQVADQYNQAGALDRYIEYLAKAVGESPKTASLHLKLGYAHEEAQQYDQAVAQWRMTLELEPDHPQRMKLLNLIEKYRARLALSAEPSRPAATAKSPKAAKAQKTEPREPAKAEPAKPAKVEPAKPAKAPKPKAPSKPPAAEPAQAGD